MPSLSALPILYALGSNSSGQLGIGHTNDVNTPQRCIFEPDERVSHPGDDSQAETGAGVGDVGPETVKKIVAGGNHTLVLTSRGRLFVAGNSLVNEQVGHIGSNEVFKEITHVFTNDTQRDPVITDVAAAWESFFVVTEGGSIYIWGKDVYDGMGSDRDTMAGPPGGSYSLRFDIEALSWVKGEKVVAIEAGMGHALIALSNGHIYGWGACRKGQLGEQHKGRKILSWLHVLDFGLEDSTLSFAPERVILGREYSVFLKTGEKPVVWGEKKFFHKNDFDWCLGPDDVAVSGWSSVHVLWRKSSLGAVASMGKNNRGQFAPACLPAVRAIAAGSEHCVALTAEGQVIAWGWGEHGNCGEKIDEKGNVRDRWNVIPIPQLKQGVVVKNVAAGCASTFVICGKEED